MNRHLHNTLCALVASGSLLVFGLIAAAPLMPHDASVAPQTLLTAASGDATPAHAPIAGLESAAEATAVAMVANAIEQATFHTIDTAPPRATRSSQRQRRQALVMPYLSFVPRG